MLGRISCATREEWLEARNSKGIGGSEAAAILGCSPWMTPIELYNLKLGITKPKDLSDNPAIERGVRLEPAIRDFYKAIHPDHHVEHYPYDMLFQEERPWLFATLDGEITAEDGKSGVLEIKTGTTQKWQEWKDGGAPVYYITQTLHQLLATGWEFAVIIGVLFRQNGDMEIVEREVWREDYQEQMDYLLSKETEFWNNLTSGIIPPQPIRLGGI